MAAVSAALQASARAAYRDLLRASASTFAGDETLLKAFRHKLRHDGVRLLSETDPKTYEEQVKLMRDVSQFLRRNIVQAVKTQRPGDGSEVWKLKLNKDTELGSNETIKCAQDAPSDRALRRQEKVASSTETLDRPRSNFPRYYSGLKRAHKVRQLPELKESDLVESFVRGSGPGGQSINKTENNVQLLHQPTGIRVNCQQTRSLGANRKIARRLLLEKLDEILNPGLSKREMQRAKQRERERRQRKKAKKKSLSKEIRTHDE